MKSISWEELYRQQAPRLLGLCRRYVKDPARAQDLLHDAFLQAISRQAQFRGTGPVEAWLRSVVVSTVLMHLRQEKRLLDLLHSDTAAAPVYDPDEPEDTDARSILLAAGVDEAMLLAAIDTLPEHHRVVFNLYVFEAYSHRQIASELGISEGTSKSHLARARKALQRHLWQYIDTMQKRKRAVFVSVTPNPSHHIDELYRQRLADYEMTPVGDLPAVLRQAMQAASTPATAAASALILPHTGTLLLLAFTLTLAGGQPPARLQQPAPEPTPLMGTAPEMPPAAASTVVAPELSTPLPWAVAPQATTSALPATTPLAVPVAVSRPKPAAPAPPPVVVRRTVVKQDTVFQIIDDHEQ